MADISADPLSWSTTASSNSPSGGTTIGSGLDDNLRAIQAALKSVIVGMTGVAGTNTITATAGNVAALVTGAFFLFVPAATNTGATTLNINGIGAKNVFCNGIALVAGELQISVPTLVYYDGTQFNIVGSFVGGAIPNTVHLNGASNSINLGTGTGIITAGATDSGGAGFKLLRVPN